jgi:hypothetical protein
MLAQTSLGLVREIPLGFGGVYLLYLLRKPGPPAAPAGWAVAPTPTALDQGRRPE